MSCSALRAIMPRGGDVKVNGVAIPRDVIARETQYHPARTPIEAWRAAARALVIRELLLQEARRFGITGEPMSDGAGRRETDEEAAMRELVAREVRTPKADTATCRRYYKQNRHRFRHNGHAFPFEMVAQRIATYLEERVERRALAQYIARLAGAARIEGIALPDAEAMRVSAGTPEGNELPGETAAPPLGRFVNNAGDDDWLKLVGQMSRADDPGEVFRQRVLGDSARAR